MSGDAPGDKTEFAFFKVRHAAHVLAITLRIAIALRTWVTN